MNGLKLMRVVRRFTSTSTLHGNGKLLCQSNPSVFEDNSLKPVLRQIVERCSKERSITFLPHSISIMNFPVSYKRDIIDPLSRVDITTPPMGQRKSEISLPDLLKSSISEPEHKPIAEKRAARLIVIRKRKMRKHKWRKLQKRMKFVFAKRRIKRAWDKEKRIQGVLLDTIRTGEKWDVETYISDQLSKAHWQRPLTHVKGWRAPDWVIKEHLQENEEKARIERRIEECLRFKKSS